MVQVTFIGVTGDTQGMADGNLEALHKEGKDIVFKIMSGVPNFEALAINCHEIS